MRTAALAMQGLKRALRGARAGARAVVLCTLRVSPPQCAGGVARALLGRLLTHAVAQMYTFSVRQDKRYAAASLPSHATAPQGARCRARSAELALPLTGCDSSAVLSSSHRRRQSCRRKNVGFRRVPAADAASCRRAYTVAVAQAVGMRFAIIITYVSPEGRIYFCAMSGSVGPRPPSVRACGRIAYAPATSYCRRAPRAAASARGAWARRAHRRRR
jgi:hypothetical protein